MLKQKLFIILCLSIIFTFVESKAYKCADELEQGGVCYLESYDSTTKLSTAYVKKCGKGKRCKSVNDETFGGCYKVKSGDELRDEDEKCKVNEECFSRNCVSGKCKYIDDGAQCDSDDDNKCKPTSYCSSENKCKAYAKAGEQCDGECINGYICGTSGSETQKKCIAKYSVTDGTAASNALLCKSGFLDDGGKCNSLTLKSQNCATDTNTSREKCTYTIKGTTQDKDLVNYGDDRVGDSREFCQLKSDGKTKACRDINGASWDTYVTAYTQRLEKIKDDKDYNRFSSKWNEDNLGDRDLSDAYVEWEYSVRFSDASDCVKDYFKDDEASSNFIVFNIMLIISFAIILI